MRWLHRAAILWAFVGSLCLGLSPVQAQDGGGAPGGGAPGTPGQGQDEKVIEGESQQVYPTTDEDEPQTTVPTHTSLTKKSGKVSYGGVDRPISSVEVISVPDATTKCAEVIFGFADLEDKVHKPKHGGREWLECTFGIVFGVTKPDTTKRGCSCEEFGFVQIEKQAELKSTDVDGGEESIPPGDWSVDTLTASPYQETDTTKGGTKWGLDFPGLRLPSDFQLTASNGKLIKKVRWVQCFQLWLVCKKPKVCLLGFIEWGFEMDIEFTDGKISKCTMKKKGTHKYKASGPTPEWTTALTSGVQNLEDVVNDPAFADQPKKFQEAVKQGLADGKLLKDAKQCDE